MDVNYCRFVVGTKGRPTMFMMKSRELSKYVEDAQLFETIEEGTDEIQKCDEPDSFKLYEVEVRVQGV